MTVLYIILALILIAIGFLAYHHFTISNHHKNHGGCDGGGGSIGGGAGGGSERGPKHPMQNFPIHE